MKTINVKKNIQNLFANKIYSFDFQIDLKPYLYSRV